MVPGRSDHVADFLDFTDSLPAVAVSEWSDAVETWEKNNDEVNPYVITVPSK